MQTATPLHLVQQIAGRTIEIVTEVRCDNEYATTPKRALIRLTTELAARIIQLQKVCQDNDAAEIHVDSFATTWESSDPDDRFECHYLVVTPRGFYVSCMPKHGDDTFTTPEVYFDSLGQALRGETGGTMPTSYSWHEGRLYFFNRHGLSDLLPDEAAPAPRGVGLGDITGWFVRTIAGEIDQDEHGKERQTPSGTVGRISGLNHFDTAGVNHWNVDFPNGASVILSTVELCDPTAYDLTPTRPTPTTTSGDLNKCTACGAQVESIIGCPNGDEVCQACFDAGHG